MKNEKEYLDHIKEAEELTKKAIQEKKVAPEFARVVFDKLVTPYHYFIKDGKTNFDSGGNDEPATKKQIKYAKDIGIENPEQYNKQELSDKIEEAR